MSIRSRRRLYATYADERATFNTPLKRALALTGVAMLVLLPFTASPDVVGIGARVLAAAVGAIGLNIVTGYAGQVSLGHAFFLGVGAYTGAILAGPVDGPLVGFGLDMAVWLPAAGLVAALFGLLVAPTAVRVKGIYLAVVTLGLVFVGEHVFKEMRSLTGGVGVGRSAGKPTLFGADLAASTTVLGISVPGTTRVYLFTAAVFLVLTFAARNMLRSLIGRALLAVRDRDSAAAAVGVEITRYKAIAFVTSSFYAGIAGALLSLQAGYIEPGSFNLLLSVDYLAMILIGGMATIAGSILGAVFVVSLPRLIELVPHHIPFVSAQSTGGGFSVFQLETILFGALIIIFLLFEPRGLYGGWKRIQLYWERWPFSH